MEPGSAKDVSKIVSKLQVASSNRRLLNSLFFTQLKILGSSRTPFAVKGGGHNTNPGFSSTPGVQIALARLNSTKVNINDETVEIGPGLTWDQVYQTLAPSGVNVIGGRTPTVGISGSTLGGGGCHAYSDGSDLKSLQDIHTSRVNMDLQLTTL